MRLLVEIDSIVAGLVGMTLRAHDKTQEETHQDGRDWCSTSWRGLAWASAVAFVPAVAVGTAGIVAVGAAVSYSRKAHR